MQNKMKTGGNKRPKNEGATQPGGAVKTGAREGRRGESLLLLLLGLGFALLCLAHFVQTQTWLILLCCALSAVLCVLALVKARPREGLPLVAAVLLLFLVWMGLSVLWANSGKLFLREFSKRLVALPLLLLILLWLPRTEKSIRRLLLLLSAAGSAYALMSVDAATLRICTGVFFRFREFAAMDTGFEAGTRLTGIFGNANISAGLLAICLFFSLYLMGSGKTRGQRGLAAALGALQAFTFLLNFSLGATGFFLLCAILYLVCAGEKRIEAFLRMLELALPTLCFVFLSFRFFERGGALLAVPLLAMVLNAAAVTLLELLLLPRLSARAAGLGRKGLLPMAALLGLLCVYAALGLTLRSGATLEPGETLRRACYPEPGSYTLTLDTDGAVNVTVVSQNTREIVMHTETELYRGEGQAAVFTVPEDSEVVYLRFTAPGGAQIRTAVLSGPKLISLHLGYPLLPGFIANRLQGLRANENAIQRLAFFRDGIRVFRDHPLLGAGLGGFESLLYGYQSFHYETKYVHNHYIQVLLDCGLIGFLLYLAVLVLTLLALWKGRKADAPFRALFPALCASFFMLLLHSAMEVVMSAAVYLPYALALPALIGLCWGKGLGGNGVKRAFSGTALALALVYAVLVLLNLRAHSSVEAASGSDLRFFSALDKAVQTDVFDRNDWRTSYVVACGETGSAAYRSNADRYAEELMEVPSNSIHQYLVRYYLSFGEVDKALEAARKGAAFNYADSSTWNTFFGIFAAWYDREPELRGEILEAVRVLNEDLTETQAKLMDSTELTDTSREIIALAGNE